MRLSDLETLAVAVQEGSLTAAARRLFVTQPAVSARLRRLEAEVGEPLLRRSGRGVRPTAAGEHLVRRARELLEEARRLEDELRGGGALSGRLSLGATDLAAIYHLPAVLRRFRRRHPGLELAIRVEGTEPLLRLLEQGQIALAVATLPVPADRFEAVPWVRDPLAVVAPAGHPLAGSVRRKPRDPAELARETWIGFKSDSVTRRLVEGFFAAAGAPIRVAMEISSPEAIKRLVQARLGIAVLPWCSVRRDAAEGRLSVIRLRGFDLERVTGVVWPRGTRLGRAAEAMHEALVPPSAL